MDQVCEMFDISVNGAKVACPNKVSAFVTYRIVHAPHSRLMCTHHLDWFLASSLTKEGTYDPVSIYSPAEADKVRGN